MIACFFTYNCHKLFSWETYIFCWSRSICHAFWESNKSVDQRCLRLIVVYSCFFLIEHLTWQGTTAANGAFQSSSKISSDPTTQQDEIVSRLIHSKIARVVEVQKGSLFTEKPYRSLQRFRIRGCKPLIQLSMLSLLVWTSHTLVLIHSRDQTPKGVIRNQHRWQMDGGEPKLVSILLFFFASINW